jgi:hypothetical protein
VVEEVHLKLTSLLKPLRCLRIVFIALIFAGTTSTADAYMYCVRAKDPMVKDRIEEPPQAIPAMKSHQVGALTTGFAIAWQDEEECRKRHLLQDSRNGAATIVFTYQGTGTIWELGSPLAVWSEPLNDDHALKALDADDFNYIEVRPPQRRLGPVWVGAMPSESKTLKACASLALFGSLVSGTSVSAADYSVDFGVDSEAGRDAGSLTCRFDQTCEARLDSLGLKIRISVPRNNIDYAHVRLGGDDLTCCFFSGGDDKVIVERRRPVSRMPFFKGSRARGGLFIENKRAGTLYLRFFSHRDPHGQLEKDTRKQNGEDRKRAIAAAEFNGL